MSPNLQRNDYVIYTDASYRNDKSGSNAGIAFLIYDFEMKHVLPANMPKAVKRVHANWAEGFNAKVKNTAATSKCTRVFF